MSHGERLESLAWIEVVRAIDHGRAGACVETVGHVHGRFDLAPQCVPLILQDSLGGGPGGGRKVRGVLIEAIAPDGTATLTAQGGAVGSGV